MDRNALSKIPAWFDAKILALMASASLFSFVLTQWNLQNTPNHSPPIVVMHAFTLDELLLNVTYSVNFEKKLAQWVAALKEPEKPDPLKTTLTPPRIVLNPLSVEEARLNKFQKTALPMTSEQQLSFNYQKAIYLLDEDKPGSAIALLQEGVRTSPRDLKTRELLAALLIRTHQQHQAENILRDGLDLNPNYIPFAKMIARLFIDKGEFSTALNILENLEGDYSYDAEYMALLGYLSQHLGKTQQALNYYSALTEKEPSNAAWWLGLGLALESAQQKPQAFQAYKRALQAEKALNTESAGFALKRLQTLQKPG